MFLLLSFENSVHIPYTNRLLGMQVFFSLKLVFSSSSEQAFHKKQILLLIEFSLLPFPFMNLAFGVQSKKSLPNTRSRALSFIIFFPKFYSFLFNISL